MTLVSVALTGRENESDSDRGIFTVSVKLMKTRAASARVAKLFGDGDATADDSIEVAAFASAVIDADAVFDDAGTV